MRINQDEINAFVKAFESIIDKSPISLYLFGSRVYDDKKGGDIDLLVLGKKDIITKIKMVKSKILIEIYKAIGERKIDIIFTTEDQLKIDPLLKKISNEMVILWKNKENKVPASQKY